MKKDSRRRAAELIWETSQAAMYKTALSILRNPHDAEDAVMEAMVRIIKNEGKFTGLSVGEMTSLAVIYVRNTAIDIYNANAKRPYPTDELPDSQDIGQTPEESAPDSDAAERLLRLIKQTPPSYRDVLLLKVKYGMDISEIADALGLENGAVRTRLSRARDWLEKHGKESGK